MVHQNPGEFNYAGSAGDAYHARRRLSPRAEQWIAKVRARKLQPHLAEDDQVFEYGVGFGWNLMHLQCASKAGFDLARNLESDLQKKNIRFVPDPAAERQAYNVVICHHTLEHVPAPPEVIELLARLLKRGGKLLLFVPLEREKKYRHFHPDNKAHHLFSWTPCALANLVAACSFKIASIATPRFRFDRIAAVAAERLHAGRSGYEILRSVGQRLSPEHEIALVAEKH